ncbi:SDR family oxidoreductase [Alkalilimnicola sp. S0819]|uniref:SDR family oxidoreductase n=1 Tax=Alkalilimnicola sp. S0819 TaxID=2613922 RepID=UPI001869FE90|nr:SDR family oxidoreductase [Alkalilimnicola sp. S0819]
MARRNFRHKVVVITGATGGIGTALCQRFGQARARVVLLDLDPELLSSLQLQLERNGSKALGLRCDITDEAACQAAMLAAQQHFGGIDVLINNAGIAHRSRFEETSAEVFRRVMEVNFFGALNCTRAALPSLLERRGMIITLSSRAGVSPQWGQSGYSASKYALHGLFESLRREYCPRELKVMMVCPGFTATDLNKNALQGDGSRISHSFSLAGSVASPADVADDIYRGAVREKDLLMLSNVSPWGRLVATLAPRFYARAVARA